MGASLPGTGRARVGGNLSSRGCAVQPSLQHEGFVPFVPPNVQQSGIMMSEEDLLDEVAAIKASIHSPKVVQARRRRKPNSLGDSSEKPTARDAMLTKKLKSIMKCTAYSGKSSKANSSREDGGFTSIFKGVTKHKATGRFEAHFWDASYERPVDESASTGRKKPRRRGKQIYLGGYETEVQAATAYDMAALAFLGDKAQLNYGRDIYAEFERMNVGKSTDAIVKGIKAQSISSRVNKKRARVYQEGPAQPNAMGMKETNDYPECNPPATGDDNGSKARGEQEAGFESPPFLPYSETKIRRQSGSMAAINELVLANGGTHMAPQHGHPGPFHGHQSSTYHPAMSPSPVPISTALKQHFNSLPPSVPPPPSTGRYSSINGQDDLVGGMDKAPSHATVTFDASGSVSGNLGSIMKGWLEKSIDQNVDIMQLSPITKGIQLSPEFSHRGIGFSPMRSGLPTPLIDLNETEVGIATFLGVDHHGGSRKVSSPGMPRMQLPTAPQ